MNNLEDKILSGYSYAIKTGSTPKEGTRSVNLYTGRGGVIEYINSCRKYGLPDEIIGESIFVHLNIGEICINNLKITNHGSNESKI